MNIMKGDNEWKDEYEGEGIKRWIWGRRKKKMNMREMEWKKEYEGEGLKRWIWGRRKEKKNMREKE